MQTCYLCAWATGAVEAIASVSMAELVGWTEPPYWYIYAISMYQMRLIMHDQTVDNAN